MIARSSAALPNRGAALVGEVALTTLDDSGMAERKPVEGVSGLTSPASMRQIKNAACFRAAFFVKLGNSSKPSSVEIPPIDRVSNVGVAGILTCGRVDV